MKACQGQVCETGSSLGSGEGKEDPALSPTSVMDDWSWLVDLVTRRAAKSFLSLR